MIWCVFECGQGHVYLMAHVHVRSVVWDTRGTQEWGALESGCAWEVDYISEVWRMTQAESLGLGAFEGRET